MNKKYCVVSVHLSLLLILVGCSDGATPQQGTINTLNPQ